MFFIFLNIFIQNIVRFYVLAMLPSVHTSREKVILCVLVRICIGTAITNSPLDPSAEYNRHLVGSVIVFRY